MIKTFQGGGRGGDIFKTPSLYKQLLPLSTPCFKMFLERSLNDPHHPTSSIFHSYPLPPPPKNFDHTQTHKTLILTHPHTDTYTDTSTWLRNFLYSSHRSENTIFAFVFYEVMHHSIPSQTIFSRQTPEGIF